MYCFIIRRVDCCHFLLNCLSYAFLLLIFFSSCPVVPPIFLSHSPFWSFLSSKIPTERGYIFTTITLSLVLMHVQIFVWLHLRARFVFIYGCPSAESFCYLKHFLKETFVIYFLFFTLNSIDTFYDLPVNC